MYALYVIQEKRLQAAFILIWSKKANLVNQRNDFVAALSDEIFIIFAGTYTGTFDLAVRAIKAGKKTYTINNTENRELIRMGAGPTRYTTHK